MRRPTRSGAAALALLALAACGEGRASGPTGDPRTEPSADPSVPRLLLTLDDDSVATATIVTARVRIENLGRAGGFRIEFGDGGPGGGWGEADTTCGVLPGKVIEETFSHAYRKPGTFTVTATFHPELCAANNAPQTDYVATADAHVTPGSTPSNGPTAPRVNATVDRDEAAVTVDAFSRDEDGWLRSVRWSWGDGTPDTVSEFPLAGCKDPSEHWPVTAGTHTAQEHRYAAPGRYAVTVTATTTGCDGNDPQTATATADVTAD